MLSFLKKKKPLGYSSRKQVESKISPFIWQILLGVGVLIVLSLLIALTWYLTRVERFLIRDIEVVGGITIPHSVVEEKVSSALVGTYFRLIPKRFILLYPHGRIVESINTVPRVKQVHVEYVGEQKITILFDEYVPFALSCEKKESKDCLFMDTSGFVFGEAPRLEGSAFVRYVNTQTEPKLREQSFSAEFMNTTKLFIDGLRERLNLYVTHVVLVDERDVEYTLTSGGVIKVNQGAPVEETIVNLETILRSKEFAHITSGDFEYIDLRFGDKVFVREEPLVATSTATTSVNE